MGTSERDIAELSAEIDRLKSVLMAARSEALSQAEDEGLWFVAETAPESYLQEALRRLHRAVDGGK